MKNYNGVSLWFLKNFGQNIRVLVLKGFGAPTRVRHCPSKYFCILTFFFRTEVYYISTRQIPLPIDAGNIIDVSAGRLHSLIATSKGVYAFGDNAHGQCGQDPEAQPFVTHNRYGQITPVIIPSDSPVVKVSNSFDRFINNRNFLLNEFLIFDKFFNF